MRMSMDSGCPVTSPTIMYGRPDTTCTTDHWSTPTATTPTTTTTTTVWCTRGEHGSRGVVVGVRRRVRRMGDHRYPGHGTGLGSVCGDSAAEGVEERGDAGRHIAVRRPCVPGDRSARRAAARLEDTDRVQERKLFVHWRPIGGVRNALVERWVDSLNIKKK